MVEISCADIADPAVRSFLKANNSDQVARRGELVNALQRPMILAREDPDLLGVLTYDIAGEDCEILTLNCARRWSGSEHSC